MHQNTEYTLYHRSEKERDMRFFERDVAKNKEIDHELTGEQRVSVACLL
jgi:hypothetical protein